MARNYSRRPDRTAEAIELLKYISSKFNIDVKSLRDPNAFYYHFIPARREFCVQGRKIGLSTIELGIALNRDRTTVSYHASPAMRAAKRNARPPSAGRSEAQRERQRKKRELAAADLLCQ